jgi:hypothetical protein
MHVGCAAAAAAAVLAVQPVTASLQLPYVSPYFSLLLPCTAFDLACKILMPGLSL